MSGFGPPLSDSRAHIHTPAPYCLSDSVLTSLAVFRLSPGAYPSSTALFPVSFDTSAFLFPYCPHLLWLPEALQTPPLKFPLPWEIFPRIYLHCHPRVCSATFVFVVLFQYFIELFVYFSSCMGLLHHKDGLSHLCFLQFLAYRKGS